MEIITTDVHTWKREDRGFQTAEGLKVSAVNLKKICEYNKIPATLVQVDSKYGTNTVLDVFKSADVKPQFAVEDNEIVSVLDPKSKFCDDTSFSQLTEIVSQVTECDFKEVNAGLQKKAVFQMKDLDTDNFLTDVFKKSASITRLPQGGVYFSTGLLRLACTNGCVVEDSQYKVLNRQSKIDEVMVKNFIDSVSNFNINAYFNSLFFKNGEPVMASVADFMGMSDLLKSLTDEDIASVYYPHAPIEEFYANQGIQLDKLSRTMLGRLPSGMSYYNAFNILTNGAKAAESLSLEDEIRIASWSKPSKLNSIKSTDIQFKGMPHFDDEFTHRLMGDIK